MAKRRPQDQIDRTLAKLREKYHSDETVREAAKKQASQWQKDNKKRKKEIQQKSDRKNRDRINTTTRAWRLANPEKVKGYVDPEADRIRCQKYRLESDPIEFARSIGFML